MQKKNSDVLRQQIVSVKKLDLIRLLEKTERDNLAFAASAHDEGLAEGLEKGKEEKKNKKAIETAKNFLKMGLSIEQVAKGTGLSIEEIKLLL